MMMINHRDPPKRCPRCESTDTKFCYFNNYSQSQPRHFCRACRRYWTDGGTLRNVPQGGGSYRRGNKRPRQTVTAPTATTSGPVPSASPQVIAPMPPPLPQPQPQPQPPFYFGGGMGSEGTMATLFQPFHPGFAATMSDFGGFPPGDNQAPFNQQLLPGLYNLAIQPPLPLQPSLDPSQMVQQQPRVAVTSCQQTNITLFASTTAGSTLSPAAATGNGKGYWNEFNNVGEGESSASRPPTPSASM